MKIRDEKKERKLLIIGLSAIIIGSLPVIFQDLFSSIDINYTYCCYAITSILGIKFITLIYKPCYE